MTYEELDDVILERWTDAGDPDAVAELERRDPTRGGLVVMGTKPDGWASDEALAGRYFDEVSAPDFRRDGIPLEGVAHLRRTYIEGATGNPEAMRQLREWEMAR